MGYDIWKTTPPPMPSGNGQPDSRKARPVSDGQPIDAGGLAMARMTKMRYCEMCDVWMGARVMECPACGMPTIKGAK